MKNTILLKGLFVAGSKLRPHKAEGCILVEIEGAWHVDSSHGIAKNLDF